MILFFLPIKKNHKSKMQNRNRALGRHGEAIAARFLAHNGYKIIGRNVRAFVGEIDIVAMKNSSIIFVEVKTRKTDSLGPPYISITSKKKRKLTQCALCYLKMRNIINISWHIDIVSVKLDPFNKQIKKIEHFENAFSD